MSGSVMRVIKEGAKEKGGSLLLPPSCLAPALSGSVSVFTLEPVRPQRYTCCISIRVAHRLTMLLWEIPRKFDQDFRAAKTGYFQNGILVCKILCSMYCVLPTILYKNITMVNNTNIVRYIAI